MQRPLFVVGLAIAVIGFSILISGYSDIPIRGADIRNDEVAVSISKTANSSASCMIAITMTGILDDQPS